MANKKLYTIEQALDYAMQYCSKQERTHLQVEKKLVSYGLSKEQSQEVIVRLIEEGFLCEQRYSDLFAISKLHQNSWGKIKIRYMLKSKGISENCIRKSLNNIDDKEYYKTLESLLEKKARELKKEKPFKRRAILQYFLLSHGFEADMVYSIIQNHKDFTE